jgi:hypothetical protein
MASIDPHNDGISLYDYSNSAQNDLKNLGYNYNETLLRKSLSSYLFRNTVLAGYLEKVNSYMVEHVNVVKYIRIYYNYTVSKNYKNID